MNYTITQLTTGNAVVTFADGAWANVPVVTADTKETFEKRVQLFATKTFGSNPSWIAADQTGSVTQVPFSVTAVEDTGNPAWLDARIAAYGPPSSQIEFITENGLAAWQAEVAKIKTDNPSS